MSELHRNAAGTVLGGRYTLLTPIAQGGMGEVWKARDRVTGHLVAAKVMRPELSGQAMSLSRLRIEARNAMRVQHLNIAAVLDHGEDDGRGWIVMELVDGRPLTDYLRGGGRLAVRDLVPVLMQVAMALNAAAEAGVVHRDIKPANILIRPDGIVKLTDFGISRTLDQATMTAAGMVMGTAQYLPPEQAMGETATAAGDLYALGVIAYECAAGRRPFTGATQVDIAFAHVNDKVPELPADVPAPFAAVVMHLMEKDPRKRPARGSDLAQELVGAAHVLGVPVAPHPLPAPADPADAAGGAPSPSTPPIGEIPHRVPAASAPVGVPLSSFAPDGAAGRHGRHAGSPAGDEPTASDEPPVDVLARRIPPIEPVPADRRRGHEAGAAEPAATSATAGTPRAHGVPGRAEAPATDDAPQRAEASATGDARPRDPRAPQAPSAVRRVPTAERLARTAAPGDAPVPTSPAADDQQTRVRSDLAMRLQSRARRREEADAADAARPPARPTLDDVIPAPSRRRGTGPAAARAEHSLPSPAAPSSPSSPAARPSPASPAARTHSAAAASSKAPAARASSAAPGERRARPAASPSSMTGRRPAWRSVTRGEAARAADAHPAPTPTRFNRSTVAPPLSRAERIGRVAVIALMIITVLLVVVATIQNKFGSLPSLLGAGTHIIEEAGTWTAPWTIV